MLPTRRKHVQNGEKLAEGGGGVFEGRGIALESGLETRSRDQLCRFQCLFQEGGAVGYVLLWLFFNFVAMGTDFILLN